MGRTDFLFVMPSLIGGAARVLDLGGVFDSGSYNESRSPAEADARAIASDWRMVGDDMQSALDAKKAPSASE